MKASNSTWVVLNDPEAIELMLDYPEIFAIFLNQQRTISEAAKETGLKLNAMAYRVKRMRAKGLLKIVKTQGKGRDLNVYTAFAEKLFVPLDQAPSQTLQALFEREGAWLENLISRSIVKVKEQMREDAQQREWGIRLYRDKQGQLQGDLAFSPEHKLDLESETAPALVDIINMEFKLNFSEAKQLQKELLDLEKKYKDKNGQNYIFRVALVPV